MNLSRKSREEIAQALADKTRSDLIDVIYSLSTIEPHFTAAEIATRSGMTKRTVLADIHKGRFGGEYFKRSPNQITVSASGVNAWRKSFRVVVKPSENPSKRNE
jgi:hypothetical protein